MVEESAADKAGLKAGDVILNFDGHEIIDEGDLAEIIRAQEPEQEVTLSIKRDGKDVEIKAVLGEKTYTTSRRGFGSRSFNIDIDIDDEHFRLNNESIHKLIQKALYDVELEFSEEDVEEFHEKMMEFKEEMKEFKKEMVKMKEEMKEQLEKNK